MYCIYLFIHIHTHIYVFIYIKHPCTYIYQHVDVYVCVCTVHMRVFDCRYCGWTFMTREGSRPRLCEIRPKVARDITPAVIRFVHPVRCTVNNMDDRVKQRIMIDNKDVACNRLNLLWEAYRAIIYLAGMYRLVGRGGEGSGLKWERFKLRAFTAEL